MSGSSLWQGQEAFILCLKIQLTLFTAQKRKLDLILSRSTLNNASTGLDQEASGVCALALPHLEGPQQQS